MDATDLVLVLRADELSTSLLEGVEHPADLTLAVDDVQGPGAPPKNVAKPEKTEKYQANEKTQKNARVEKMVKKQLKGKSTKKVSFEKEIVDQGKKLKKDFFANLEEGGIVGENLPVSDSSNATGPDDDANATDSDDDDAEKLEDLVDETQPPSDATPQEPQRRPRKPPGFYSNMGFLAMLKIVLLLFVFLPPAHGFDFTTNPISCLNFATNVIRTST